MIEGMLLFSKKVVFDQRGKSCKIYSKEEREMDEIFVSYSKKNVIRGIHFQEEPFSQQKIVTVLKGRIRDVVIDLRPDSKTFLEVNEFELDEKAGTSLLIPKGCGHGFLALEQENIVLYEIEGKYNAEADKGILWSSIGYEWSVQNPILSNRDREFMTLENYLKGIKKEYDM